MAGIHVLSDAFKVGNKIGKTLTSEGKTAAKGTKKNAAQGFAEVLSGKIKPTADSKGQSSTAGQESEEKQSINDQVQVVQNQDGSVNTLEYGNFAMPFLSQLVLQSDLPAGKEANSGDDVTQGIEDSAPVNSLFNASVTGNKLELAMLKLLSQVSDEFSVQSGMTTLKPQGDNTAIPELDKYRQVIADLLDKLSGDISDISVKGTPLSLEGSETKDLSQDIAKIVQGWLMASDDVTKDGQPSSAQKEIQPLVDVLTAGIGKDNPSLNTKASSQLEALKETTVLPKVKGMHNQELFKGEGAESLEPSETKVTNQNSNTGFGSVANILTENVTEGKTVTSPIVEQIATAFRGQVVNGHQALRNLDIQLHPAELGKIGIAMRWENGQVHLQVQASEAATGQLLHNQLSDLRQLLMDQGVNCGMLEMGQGGEQQKNPHGEEPQSRSNLNSLPNEDEDIITVFDPLSLGEDEINRINVTA